MYFSSEMKVLKKSEQLKDSHSRVSNLNTFIDRDELLIESVAV